MALRVKVCGITSPEDALVAVGAGADAIGLVFARSLRHVTVARARKIVQVLPPLVMAVGVFADAQPAQVRAVLTEVPLGALQFHGAEGPDAVAGLGRPVLKAFGLLEPGDAKRARGFLEALPGAWLLLDSERGGSGRPCNWDLAAELARESPVVLAGGLTPANVAAAVARVRPWAVDVSSGVESAPGRKDESLIRAFVRAARGAAAS